MFNFEKFYNNLLKSKDFFNPFDDPWQKFPSNMDFKFKNETLYRLKEDSKQRDAKRLAVTLGIICHDGADKDYTETLLLLLDADWHTSEEDIVSVLEIIKDPKSVDKLYNVAIDVPDYDEMRALAKKCMWALSAINTPEARRKLELLKESADFIIKENATFQLEHLTDEK